MKWLYIGFGALGGIITIVFMTYRTWLRFHEVAVALTRANTVARADVEWNVLLVLGTSMGVMLIPVGIGLGIVVAAIINIIWERYFAERSRASDTNLTSWVTRRRSINQSRKI